MSVKRTITSDRIKSDMLWIDSRPCYETNHNYSHTNSLSNVTCRSKNFTRLSNKNIIRERNRTCTRFIISKKCCKNNIFSTLYRVSHWQFTVSIIFFISQFVRVKFNIENDTEVTAESCIAFWRRAFSFRRKFRDRDQRIIERTIAAG